MSMQFQELEKQVLQLPFYERELLIQRLVMSLQNESVNDVDEHWIQEAEKRYEELKTGKVKGIKAHND